MMTNVPNYAAKYAAEAARVDFLRDEAKDLKVRWDKGMNYFSSFFAELERLRPQIGDDKLNDWCFWNMGIGLKTIMGTARILQEEDARRVRDEMKIASDITKAKAAQERYAIAAEKAAKLAAVEAARQQRETEEQRQRETVEAETRRQRDLAMANLTPKNSQVTDEIVGAIKERILKSGPANLRRNAIMTDLGISRKIYDRAVERARGELSAERTINGYAPSRSSERSLRPRRRDSRDTLAAMSEQLVIDTIELEPNSSDDLANGMRADLEKIIHGRLQAEKGRREWIEGSLGLAEKLRKAKEIYPSPAAFSRWLSDHGCGEEVLPHHARAALIKMGHHLTAARDALERVPSWSWEVIWRNELGHLTNVRKSAFDEEMSVPAVIH
jgi:hypothetical protein